ncbi:MAG: hypothetical protein ACI87A_002632, partial [Planctomycetota bacterium]
MSPAQSPHSSKQSAAQRAQWTAYGLGAFSGLILTLLIVELKERRSPDLQLYRAVRDFVEAEFVEELSSEEILDRALFGMVRSLDNFSNYYGP